VSNGVSNTPQQFEMLATWQWWCGKPIACAKQFVRTGDNFVVVRPLDKLSRVVWMTQEFGRETPRSICIAELLNSAVKLGCRACREVFNEQIPRKLFPVCESEKKKSLGKSMNVGLGKCAAWHSLCQDFSKHTADMIQRVAKFVAQLLLAHYLRHEWTERARRGAGTWWRGMSSSARS